MIDKNKINALVTIMDQMKSALLELIEEPAEVASLGLPPEEATPIGTPFLNPGWPHAIDPALVCDTTNEEQKTERATHILQLVITEDYKNKKLLDFGCGEGHVAHIAGSNGAIATGYDITRSGELPWESDDKTLLTTDLEKVKARGPYDIIVLYDVIDHAENKLELLQTIRSLATPGTTKVYVRCHPWISRFGGHQYTTTNKAYSHLFGEIPAHVLAYPKADYKYLFDSAGLSIVWKENVVDKQRIEEIIRGDLDFQKAIARIYKNPAERKFAHVQLEQNFMDFVLVPVQPVVKPKPAVVEIARFKHSVNQRMGSPVMLMSNGKIGSPHSLATWTLDGNRMRFRWPNAEAPNGAWVDQVVLSPDFRTYSGRNQAGMEIKGSLMN